MTEYIRISPDGPTFHILSGRYKRFGALTHRMTYCGLRMVPRSVIEQHDEPPATLCRVCQKRSQPSS